MQDESLYKVVSTDSTQNRHTICVVLNPLHSLYKGHFPEQPVLPGVCTLQIIRECAGAILNKNIRFATISQCKFTSMIIPDETPIELSLTISDGNTLQAIVMKEGSTMLKLKSTFTDI